MTTIHAMNARHKKGHIRKCSLDCLTSGRESNIFTVLATKMSESYTKAIKNTRAIVFTNTPIFVTRRSFQAVGISAYQIIAIRNTLLTIMNQLRPLRGGTNSVNVTCKGADLPSVGDWLLITGLGKVKSRGVTNSLSLDKL